MPSSSRSYLKRLRKRLLKILIDDCVDIKNPNDPNHPLVMFYQDLENALDHLDFYIDQGEEEMTQKDLLI